MPLNSKDKSDLSLELTGETEKSAISRVFQGIGEGLTVGKIVDRLTQDPYQDGTSALKLDDSVNMLFNVKKIEERGTVDGPITAFIKFVVQDEIKADMVQSRSEGEYSLKFLLRGFAEVVEKEFKDQSLSFRDKVLKVALEKDEKYKEAEARFKELDQKEYDKLKLLSEKLGQIRLLEAAAQKEQSSEKQQKIRNEIAALKQLHSPDKDVGEAIKEVGRKIVEFNQKKSNLQKELASSKNKVIDALGPLEQSKFLKNVECAPETRMFICMLASPQNEVAPKNIFHPSVSEMMKKFGINAIEIATVLENFKHKSFNELLKGLVQTGKIAPISESNFLLAELMINAIKALNKYSIDANGLPNPHKLAMIKLLTDKLVEIGRAYPNVNVAQVNKELVGILKGIRESTKSHDKERSPLAFIGAIKSMKSGFVNAFQFVDHKSFSEIPPAHPDPLKVIDITVVVEVDVANKKLNDASRKDVELQAELKKDKPDVALISDGLKKLPEIENALQAEKTRLIAKHKECVDKLATLGKKIADLRARLPNHDPKLKPAEVQAELDKLNAIRIKQAAARDQYDAIIKKMDPAIAANRVLQTELQKVKAPATILKKG